MKKMIYIEVEPQLIVINDDIVKSTMFEYGNVYNFDVESGYFYKFSINGNIVSCGKDHFVTEKKFRKLKLERINEISDGI